MTTANTRPCPDCNGKGIDRRSAGGGNLCGRCNGDEIIEHLGACEGIVFDDTQEGSPKIACVLPADRQVTWEGEVLLCDGHAIAKALELGKPCPACGGNPGAGMHRGEVVGQGKVMTCGSSQNVRDLQTLSSFASLAPAARQLGVSVAQATDAIEKLSKVFGDEGESFTDDEWDEADAHEDESLSYAAPLTEDEEAEIVDHYADRFPAGMVLAQEGDEGEDEDEAIAKRVDFDLVKGDRVSEVEVSGIKLDVVPPFVAERSGPHCFLLFPDHNKIRWAGDDDGSAYGDECLTDSERNPSLGGPPDRLW